MKKLVSIFALAAIAGAGFAAVDSQNIVGYQELGGTVNALISTAPTFINVGSSGAITLGDITVNDAGQLGGIVVRFFDASGYPLAEGDYVYVPAEEMGLGDADGWYLSEAYENVDFSPENCRNSKAIPAGTGFVFIPTTDGAELKFIGEVKNGEKEISGNVNDLIRVGNATPKNLTLGDIMVNDAGQLGGIAVRFFDASGYPLAEGDYVYVPADEMGLGGDDGWYLSEAYENVDFSSENCRNSKPLVAGSGFVAIPTTDGAKLIIPNPLSAN